MSSTTDAVNFIDQLKDDESFRHLVYTQFRELAPGDWTGLCRVAANLGYNFSPSELTKVLPDGFFQSMGSIPNLGWSTFTKSFSEVTVVVGNYADQIGAAADKAGDIAKQGTEQVTSAAKKTYKVLTDW